MKIDFTKVSPESVAEKNTASYVSAAGKTGDSAQTRKAGYRLDISGIVKDNRAYEGHGKTGEDVCEGMSDQDMTNARNYMTVMSNSLSAEDYGKLMEDGEEPSYAEAGTTSTILDAVKVALIKSGKEVEGFTTNIDRDVVEKLTGSETYANELTDSFSKYDIPVTKENVSNVCAAAENARSITPLSDGAMKYMVENDIEPTISGMYESQFCASGDGTEQASGYYASDADGYYAEKADDPDFDKLKPQIDKVITDAGLENSDDTQNECRWIISRGIPLTTDSLLLFDEIKSVNVPLSDGNIFDAAASAISDGKNAQDGNLSDTRNMTWKSLDLIEEVNSISDEAVTKAVSEERTLTVKSLSASQREIDVYLSEAAAGSANNNETAQEGNDNKVSALSATTTLSSEKIMNAEKTLASVRLSMTVRSNLILLGSGYSIDTAPLEKLASDLETAYKQSQKDMFGDGTIAELDTKNNIYENTLKISSSLKEMPAALIGDYSVNDSSFTLQNTYDSGYQLQQRYEKAGQTYEAVGTSPRSDLGDSITKAFANTDDLLSDIGMEQNSDNERAVRILGYNNMEITKDNVERVTAADATLRGVIRKMTPATVLDTVRNGVNPLDMNVSDLDDLLSSSDMNSSREEAGFGKFIYSMEQNGSITEDERTSCVGIYRLFSQIEKGDDAAVGAVLDTGSEMTFENLLSAIRTSKKGSVDYKVDDSFSGVDSVRQNESISDQIRAAFADTAGGSDDSADRSQNSEDPSGRSQDDSSAGTSQQSIYYRALASEVISELTPKKILDADIQADTTISEFADEIRGQGSEETSNSSYIASRMSEIQNQQISEDSSDEMFTYSLPVTIDNISGMQSLRHNRGSWYRDISSKETDDSDIETSDADESDGDTIADDILDSFTDKESAVKAVSKMTEQLDSIISDSKEDLSIGYLDLKKLQSSHIQLGIIRSLATEENYEVPVDIDGEKTSIHLKLIHDSENGGHVSVTMDTESLGCVAADMSVTDGRVSGYVACDNEETVSFIRSSQDEITGELDGKIDVIASKDVGLEKFERASNERYRNYSTSAEGSADRSKEGTDTNTLYRLAASFIKTIKGGTT